MVVADFKDFNGSALLNLVVQYTFVELSGRLQSFHTLVSRWCGNKVPPSVREFTRCVCALQTNGSVEQPVSSVKNSLW